MANEDVSGDGGVLKRTLQAGTGVQPQRGHTVFDSTKGKPHRAEFGFYFTLGAGEVITGWDVGFGAMRVGEKAVLTCRSDYAYGDQGMPGVIPQKATLEFEVELLDSRKLSAAERDTIDAKVAAARR